jgi:hypothetical protein
VQVDSKRQLEESLKWACNSFIQHASNSLADGLISLLKMVEAFLPPDRTAPSPEQASILTKCLPVGISTPRLIYPLFADNRV